MQPQPWPPALRAILWMDAVLLIGVGCALAGRAPALHDIDGVWAWLALAGSTLTAALGALAAFHMASPRPNQTWTMLPVPALVLWISATALGYLTMPPWVETWGATAAEAADCLAFLVTTGVPLLGLIVFMLWRAAFVPPRALAMGALASAGAATTLLTLVHPHAASALDLCAHAAAIVLLLGIAAAARSCIRASA